LGLIVEARRIVEAGCVECVPRSDRSPLPLYYLAYFASLSGDGDAARAYLKQAAAIDRDFIFASRAEAVDVLRYAVKQNPKDGRGHLQLGNVYANLGRLDEAVSHWEEAAKSNPSLSMALRNLGLVRLAIDRDRGKAAALYARAIAARPQDQTLYRDLAEIYIADGRRGEAIRLLETMPSKNIRRADVIIMLAGAYLAEKRYDDCIGLLKATPYFVNWEGQDITWVMFNKAHVARGRERMEKKDFAPALADFQAALTYPENLGVGRSDKPEEAAAQYWRGKALAALGRLEEARKAWKAGDLGADVAGQQNEYRQKCREALQRDAPANR